LPRFSLQAFTSFSKSLKKSSCDVKAHHSTAQQSDCQVTSIEVHVAYSRLFLGGNTLCLRQHSSTHPTVHTPHTQPPMQTGLLQTAALPHVRCTVLTIFPDLMLSPAFCTTPPSTSACCCTHWPTPLPTSFRKSPWATRQAIKRQHDTHGPSVHATSRTGTHMNRAHTTGHSRQQGKNQLVSNQALADIERCPNSLPATLPI
jgi:hypothetical protein